MSAPSPIFVAGTGRSGTSQLANILGEHPQIHRIPIETHFIVDPGGLRDLADALTIRYDPIVLRDSLLISDPAQLPGSEAPTLSFARHHSLSQVSRVPQAAWHGLGQRHRAMTRHDPLPPRTC
jgi:hypothetical protein